MSDNNEFKLQLVRVIGRLYQAHPTALTLASDELWEPPLTQTTSDYARKSAISGGTLTWMYRHDLVSGEFHQTNNGGGYITGAQLTARAYRLASSSDSNHDGKAFGQVAVEAASSRDPVPVDWVARRSSELLHFRWCDPLPEQITDQLRRSRCGSTNFAVLVREFSS